MTLIEKASAYQLGQTQMLIETCIFKSSSPFPERVHNARRNTLRMSVLTHTSTHTRTHKDIHSEKVRQLDDYELTDKDE